jgi:phage FluMu protein Com
MPRPCSICRRDDRGAIDAALRAGAPLRDVAQQFACTVSAVFRHAHSHVFSAPTPAAPPPPAAEVVARAELREKCPACRLSWSTRQDLDRALSAGVQPAAVAARHGLRLPDVLEHLMENHADLNPAVAPPAPPAPAPPAADVVALTDGVVSFGGRWVKYSSGERFSGEVGGLLLSSRAPGIVLSAEAGQYVTCARCKQPIHVDAIRERGEPVGRPVRAVRPCWWRTHAGGVHRFPSGHLFTPDAWPAWRLRQLRDLNPSALAEAADETLYSFECPNCRTITYYSLQDTHDEEAANESTAET